MPQNPTEGEVGEAQQASRYDLVRALAPRYAHAGKREKGQLLDEVCHLTGYTRKHALFTRQIDIRTFADWTDVNPGVS